MFWRVSDAVDDSNIGALAEQRRALVPRKVQLQHGTQERGVVERGARLVLLWSRLVARVSKRRLSHPAVLALDRGDTPEVRLVSVVLSPAGVS